MFSAMISGALLADPQQRIGKSGKVFAAAKVRFVQGDRNGFASVIAFGEVAESLLQLRAGDSITVAGKAVTTAWADKTTDEPRSGLHVVANALLTAHPMPLRRMSIEVAS